MLKLEALYNWLYEEGYEPELVEDDTQVAIPCPICDDDRPRLYIGTDTGAWICFHCGEQGGLQRFLITGHGLSGGDAFEVQRKMKPRRSDDEDLFDHFEPKPKKEKVVEKLTLPWDYHPIGHDSPKVFTRYLEGRGIDIDLAAEHGLGFAVSGRYANRIIVPNQSDGKLYTFIARTVLKKCPSCEETIDECSCRPFRFPKVLTPTKKHGAEPSLTLYNLDWVRRSKSKRVVVVEGWADALHRPDEAVALSGSKASATQLTLLAGLARGREIILALDGDEAGYKGTFKIAEALTAEMVRVKVALLPDGFDPGEMDQEEFEECLAKAQAFTL